MISLDLVIITHLSFTDIPICMCIIFNISIFILCVCICFDAQVRIWNAKAVTRGLPDEGTVSQLLATLRDHFGSVNCVRWAKHGRFIASGSDDQVIMIHERKPGSGTTEFGSGEPPDVENWKVAMTLRGHTADVVIRLIQALCVCVYRYIEYIYVMLVGL